MGLVVVEGFFEVLLTSSRTEYSHKPLSMLPFLAKCEDSSINMLLDTLDLHLIVSVSACGLYLYVW